MIELIIIFTLVFIVFYYKTKEKTYEFQIAKADVPNGNGRIYSRKVLENCIKEFKPMKGYVLGNAYPKINEITHLVKSLYMKDDYLMAKIKILDKKILTETLKFRTYGTAAVDNKVIQEDYKLIAITAIPDGNATEIF